MRSRIRLRIDKERCKGCELCVSVCSRRVLVMAHELNSRGDHYAAIADISQCTGCGQCAVICPDVAIEIEMEDDECSPEC